MSTTITTTETAALASTTTSITTMTNAHVGIIMSTIITMNAAVGTTIITTAVGVAMTMATRRCPRTSSPERPTLRITCSTLTALTAR